MQREFHQRMLRPPPRLALDTRGGWPSTVFVCGPSLAEVIILGALVSQQGFSMRCAQHLVTRSSIGVSYRGFHRRANLPLALAQASHATMFEYGRYLT